MRIIAFILDAHSIGDIMKAPGIPDFHASPHIPKFINVSHPIDELPPTTPLSPSLTTSRLRLLCDGAARV
jgi:hypothetical protein